MRLTDEQRDAVDHPGSCLVKACPGSGKTRAIVAKLMNVSREMESSPRRVACITFTNVAVDEIGRRIEEVGGLPDGTCEVSTIHGFCLQNILRPYSHMHADLGPSFTVLAQDSPALLIAGRAFFGGQFEQRKFREKVLNIHRDATQPGRLFVPSELDYQAGSAFYAECRRRNWLTAGDIIAFSEELVTGVPFIRRALSSRFAWLVIDEFQDTSPGQASIIRMVLSGGGTKVFIVGDENQSIFGFQNARPDIFARFSTEVANVTAKHFTGNFRSSRRIVAIANQLCISQPAMEAVGENTNFPEVVTTALTDDAATAVCDDFLEVVRAHNLEFGKCAVLAQAWYLLRPIGKELVRRGVPVSGPGARPYHWSHDFPALAEAAAACATRLTPSGIQQLDRVVGRIEAASKMACQGRVTSWIRRTASARIRIEARRIAEENQSAIEWLREFAASAAQILLSYDCVDARGAEGLVLAGAEMEERIRNERDNGNTYAVERMRVADLGFFANPTEAVRLLTFHGSKGMEFDAVALIELHEGIIPHSSAGNNPLRVEEDKRLLYVGCTRARKVLRLYTHSNQLRRGKLQCRFLEGIEWLADEDEFV